MDEDEVRELVKKEMAKQNSRKDVCPNCGEDSHRVIKNTWGSDYTCGACGHKWG